MINCFVRDEIRTLKHFRPQFEDEETILVEKERRTTGSSAG
jgi:hypothetical protein